MMVGVVIMLLVFGVVCDVFIGVGLGFVCWVMVLLVLFYLVLVGLVVGCVVLFV